MEIHCLWILGDERVVKGGSIWESLILDAKARKCFFQADEHIDLAKVIVEVKTDLRQLDELLNGETTLFRSTAWKVLFSRMFIESFSKIVSWEIKKLVLLMLLKLSSGWRPKRSYTATVIGESPYCDLMKEFKVKGMHLICTVDIVKETQYTQVLKVWDILPFHEIPELVKRLERIIGTYTPEYIERCKTGSLRGSEFPIKWPLTSEITQCKTHDNFPCDDIGNGCVENVKVRESLLLMKFYSLSTTAVNNMISGCDGGDLALPFELTEQEKDVVAFDKSSFILGRSGTGKTTVLTTKLFQNEQLHHLACEGFHEATERNKDVKQDVLHQLFVTFSPKLCYAVKKHISEWKRLTCGGSSSSQNCSLCIDDIDVMMLSEDIPDHLIHLSNDAYPLVITFHRFLLMLDKTVGTSYFERVPYVRQLICSNQTSTSRLAVLEHYMRFKDVTYERFCSAYWPHFNNKLTKNFDPSTLYTEIMSVIKGGLAAGEAPSGILSKGDYVSLSDSRISMFNAQKREHVYSIFLQYEKKKVENGHFDLADLVNDLHQRLEVEGYKGDLIDYVYIDEVQDLSMRQIMLFKYVCRNVHEGFSFSGDTAQAIAKGIGFRFEDIRCLFFKKFLLGSERGKMSKIFQLSENFRTHAGVLDLAQSVIDVLCRFFPLFVDALSRETSQISGELPILLETDITNNDINIIFERGGGISQQITGFGAEQVVLVRDESVKEKVIGIVGKNALVLTIIESKGLEFQDVLLYDFFTTSSFSNEWRIIYDYMKEKDLPNSSSTALGSCFHMEKHAVLCSELKQLYVAITRTRQRLWIFETTGFSYPIYDYWKKLGLVEVKHLSDHLFADKMQIPSSKDEWKSRGLKLFHENNFIMAQMCFSKAGNKHSERLAEAYQLRAIADGTWASQLERKKLFKDAAKLFSDLGKEEQAADCFFEVEDYRTAGDIYLSKSMWEKAGNCFYLGKCYERAVEEYEKAGAFAKCLSACADGKLFEMGRQLLVRWGGCGGDEVEFWRKGAIHYHGVKDFKNMMTFVRSFHSKDDMRRFLKEKRCFDELISLEVEWGKFKNAAVVSRLKRDPVTEANLHKDELRRESSLIILWHVFYNSQIFQCMENPFTQKNELLRKAVSLAKQDSDISFYRFVCKEAKNLSEGETQEELLRKGVEFVYSYKENALAMRLEWVKSTHEIKKIVKDMLDMMRSFLKSVNRLHELLLLNEVCGEFVEAAKINQEDEFSIEAAFRRLWYVFFGSLWARGKRAWPLKNFKQKEMLLDDANICLEYHSDSKLLELVLTEISILSMAEISLSQMWRYLREMPKERSLRIQFLVSRSILDVHLHSDCMVDAIVERRVGDGMIKYLEDILPKKIVSVEGLIYFWTYWKELIWEIIKWSYTWYHGCNSSKIYEDFILNYFGVRKYDRNSSGSYVVLDAEAPWVKDMKPVMHRNGYLYIISAHQLSYVASRYWCSELLFVAEKVLRKLQSLLHASSTGEIFSIHKQTKILSSLSEVTKSLQKCKFPHSKNHASAIVDQYVHPCIDHFLSNVFLIDWKYAQSKEMVSLRENVNFLNTLKEVIDMNMESQKGLTCWQLGRLAMIFLGYKLIGLIAGTERNIRCSSSLQWSDLFGKLMNGYKSSSKNGDLARSLHNVLKETFSASWRKLNDFMSPSCFIYLMERLLTLSSCIHGCVFTTRSSLVKWLTYEDWAMCLNGSGVTCLDTMKNIHHSLASMIGKMLSSKDDLMEWVKRSKEEDSYTILVLRLIVLLSLICANSERHCHHLFQLLRCPHLASLLPSKFRKTLIKGIKKNCLVDALAVACEEIDNPLVIVCFTQDFSKAPCQKAIFLDMTKLNLREEMVMEMLYSEKCDDDSTASCTRECGAQTNPTFHI
ncbi:DNA helicase, UvrD/REP type, P-loop containing nucleoside triphosphate hydrolase [Artemisia annua]|uniref:DNA helicase, UvrD/REP type, P-loop containing nucleoside triphosphate hydrolase n=1 Tax=Artemisia annua TaxID=35608 RepID=A0A2U1KYQ4_ARTAN|nr:DNA helicase, UvrD/REP type, P-loop containing nucleoside triphosphate hydrolase [Artemisia annua]